MSNTRLPLINFLDVEDIQRRWPWWTFRGSRWIELLLKCVRHRREFTKLGRLLHIWPAGSSGWTFVDAHLTSFNRWLGTSSWWFPLVGREMLRGESGSVVLPFARLIVECHTLNANGPSSFVPADASCNPNTRAIQRCFFQRYKGPEHHHPPGGCLARGLIAGYCYL